MYSQDLIFKAEKNDSDFESIRPLKEDPKPAAKISVSVKAQEARKRYAEDDDHLLKASGEEEDEGEDAVAQEIASEGMGGPLHYRGNSDYHNANPDIRSATSLQSPDVLTKRVIHLIESGLSYLNAEQTEDALRAFKQCEQIFAQHPGKLDDNYLAVLKYNLGCCYQRVGQNDLCVRSLQEGIDAIDRKIVQIKDRSNLSFIERSLTQLSTISQSQEDLSSEVMIGNLLHKYRYQCKFHLQICAVLSQLNKHELAYEYGDKAASYAQLLMHKSYELCQILVNEMNASKNQPVKTAKRGSLSTVQGAEEDFPADSFSPYGPKNQSTASYKQLPQPSAAQPKSQYNNYFNKTRDSNSLCNRSQDSQNSTKFNIRRASSADGSLERIHTFNLKLQRQQQEKSQQEIVSVNAAADGGSGSNLPLNLSKINVSSQSRNGGGALKEQNSMTSVASHKAYYVEEKTKVLESVLIKIQPVVAEFQRIIKEFASVNTFSEAERNQMFKGKMEKVKRQMKISFHEDTDINLLKFNHKFKLNVRNILGIKHQDDWIFNLNIGNVMHLSPMNSDELAAKLDRTHELNKDAMLEKIILFVVSFFCVGTELRFLGQKEGSQYTKKDSEMWHAKSLHVACLFLPEDCPLVTHIINSYKKHHLNPKLEQQKLKRIEEDLKKQQRSQHLTQTTKDFSVGMSEVSTMKGVGSMHTSQEENISCSVEEIGHGALTEIKQQIEQLLSKSKHALKRNPNINSHNTVDQLTQQKIKSKRKSSGGCQSRNSSRPPTGPAEFAHSGSMKTLPTAISAKPGTYLQHLNPQLYSNIQSTQFQQKRAKGEPQEDLSKKQKSNLGGLISKEQIMNLNIRRFTNIGSPKTFSTAHSGAMTAQASQNTSHINLAAQRSRPLSPRDMQILTMANKSQLSPKSKQQKQMFQKKLNTQIIDQIISKTTTLEQALHKQGPKKIHVFNHKNKFIDKAQSPKHVPVAAVSSKPRMQQSASQRSLGGVGKTPKSGQGSKAVIAGGAQKIEMHYQTSSRNEEVKGLKKYKSLENFPIGEILNEITKQKQMQGRHHQGQMEGYRPTSSGPIKGTPTMQGQSHQSMLTMSQKQAQRMGSPTGSNGFIGFKVNQPALSPQQQQHLMQNYNFQNVNFISNVNIFEDRKQADAASAPRRSAASQMASSQLYKYLNH